MYACGRFSCPSFFHPSTNRRIYKLLSSGLVGAPEACPDLGPGFAYYDVWSPARQFLLSELPATS